MKAIWINEDNYDLRTSKEHSHWYRSVQHVTCHLDAPPTYIDKAGRAYRWHPDFFCDQGSVPWLFQWAIPKDRFLGFYCHDTCYQFGGLWIRQPGETEFKFCRLPRIEADDLLHDMCLADPDPAMAATANMVWAAVRVGGAGSNYGSDPYGTTLIENPWHNGITCKQKQSVVE